MIAEGKILKKLGREETSKNIQRCKHV